MYESIKVPQPLPHPQSHWVRGPKSRQENVELMAISYLDIITS